MSERAQSSIAAAAAGTRPPAVLQVVPALESGGVERGTVEIAAGLRDAGWRALVASSGGAMEPELARLAAEHVTLPLDRKNPFVIHRNASQLARLIEARGVDLIHARSRAPAWSALLAARRTGRPFVTTFHGAYHETPLKHWYNAVMAKGDAVIAISDFIAEHVRRYYAVDDDRLVTIHRGVDTAAFDPARVSAERIVQLARAWRLDDGAAVVMLPARLTRLKGQAVLLQAMARLGRADAVCVLLGGDHGSPGYAREVERVIRQQGLGGRVRIVPPCRDMAAAYMLADVVVSTSTRPEGFGRTIAEAQAMGRPVIASAHGGAPEIVRPGETGWLTPPGDAAALEGALREALSLSQERRERMARAARAGVLARFSLTTMQARTLAVYRELLPRR